jgi:hypothetical protein
VRVLAVFFVGDKEFEGGQKKGSEPTLSLVGAIKISPFEYADEELLCETLRLIGRITAPTQIGIQWIPVIFTERDQSGPRFLAMRIAGDHHQVPARCRKAG